MQYHFKDKAGLVAAILEDRVGRIETLRREQLAAMQLQGRDDPRELLRVLWLPILAIRDNARLSGKLAAHAQLDLELILDMAVGASAVRT